MKRFVPALIASCALAALPAPAQAQPAFGLLPGGKKLVGFDTRDPGSFRRTLPVVGLSEDERLATIDYRISFEVASPDLPQALRAMALYGLSTRAGSDEVRLYRIAIDSGHATPVGPPVSLALAGEPVALSFEPSGMSLRVISSGGTNATFALHSGAVLDVDSPIAPPPTSITGAAYLAMEIGRPTGLLAYDGVAGQFGFIGSFGGSPLPTSSGIFAPVAGKSGADAGARTPIDSGWDEGVFYRGTSTFAAVTTNGAQLLHPVVVRFTAPDDQGAAMPESVELSAGLRLQTPITGLAVMPSSRVDILEQTAQIVDYAETARAVVQEGAGSRTIRVGRSRTLDVPQRVTWRSSVGQSGEFTFEADSKYATFVVPVLDDAVIEPDETIEVTITPDFPGYGFTDLLYLTIIDDDAPKPTPTPTPISSLSPTPVATPDVQPPRLTLSSARSISGRALRSRGLKVTATADEPAKLVAELVGETTGGQRAARKALAIKNLPLGAGRRSFVLRPTIKALKQHGKLSSVTVRITATDAAGNRSPHTRTVKVTS